MATRAELYAERVEALLEHAKALAPEAERALEEMLAKASTEILSQIAIVDPQSYTATQLAHIRTQIDQALSKFRIAASDKIGTLQSHAATLAVKDVTATVAAGLGRSVSHGSINMTTVRIAQGYSADLISNLSLQAAGKVKAAVQGAFLGGQSRSQIIEGVGRALDDGKFTGIFTATGDRAMKVASNEVMRMHSISGQARLADLATRNASVKKMWRHIKIARVPRPSHVAADGQIVPADEPFIVGGEELMFPRDPSGTPENTIFCHCSSIPYIADADLYATASDRAVLAKYGLKVSRGK